MVDDNLKIDWFTKENFHFPVSFTFFRCLSSLSLTLYLVGSLGGDWVICYYMEISQILLFLNIIILKPTEQSVLYIPSKKSFSLPDMTTSKSNLSKRKMEQLPTVAVK